MIKKEKKFTISNFSNEELGGKNYLMQTVEELEAAKLQSEGQVKAAKVQGYGKTAVDAELINTTKEAAKLQAEGQIKAAKVQGDGKTAVDAKFSNPAIEMLGKLFGEAYKKLSQQNSPDSKTLDANENKVIAIIIELAKDNPELLTNPTKLMQELNDRRSRGEGIEQGIIPFTTVDNSLAMQLEKALKADGKLLKADGKIDIETLTATLNLIADNIPAIEKSAIIAGSAALIGGALKNTGASLGNEAPISSDELQKKLESLNQKLQKDIEKHSNKENGNLIEK